MGAPAGYPDLDLQVFGVTEPIPGPAKIFSHGSPGSAGQIPAGHGYSVEQGFINPQGYVGKGTKGKGRGWKSKPLPKPVPLLWVAGLPVG
jgi:hypothetical protein